MPAKAVDEGGHMRVPEHCHVPHESERHAGCEVDDASTGTIAFAAMGRSYTGMTRSYRNLHPLPPRRCRCLRYGFNHCLNQSTAATAVVLSPGSW